MGLDPNNDNENYSHHVAVACVMLKGVSHFLHFCWCFFFLLSGKNSVMCFKIHKEDWGPVPVVYF